MPGDERQTPRFHRRLRFHLRSADRAVFLHTPHTGGGAFYRILASGFPAGDVWPMARGDPLAEEAGGFDIAGSCRLFYTQHDYSLYRRFVRKPVYLMLLRHPVARAIECYERTREDESHPLHEEVRARNLSLKEFLAFPPARDWVVNRQLRQMIGGLEGGLDALSPEVMLELARLRLEEFAFIGLSERLADSRELLRYTFDLPRLRRVPRSVVRRMSADPKGYGEESLRFAAHINRLELRMYQVASRTFERRMRQMRYEFRNPPSLKYAPGAPRDYRRISLRVGIMLRRWRGTVLLGRLRRWLIPEGSRREKRYRQLRKRIFGW